MLKKILVLVLMFIILTVTVCYAEPVKVTEENLKEAFERFMSEENSDVENAEISVENNVIKLTAEGETISFNYDLTDNPTFSMDVLVEEGMTQEEFSEKTGMLIMPILGYVAVANIQGAEMEDSAMYMLFSLLGSAVEENNNTLFSFSSEDFNTNTEEFNVMEYVNKTYKEKQIVSDSNELNSYTYTTEMKDVTETSCKLVATVSVNLDANFSELNGYMEQMEEQMDESVNNWSEQMTSQLEKEQMMGNTDNSNNIADLDKLPETGEEKSIILNTLYTMIGVCCVCLVTILFAAMIKKK